MPPSDGIHLTAHGLSFSALACGDGPPVLCLHGFPDHLRSFRLQLPALADAGHRAIAPALRGYEPDSQPSERVADYHPMRVADDVIVWAEQLGGVHLVGHDWGGIVAYLAAAQRPELFHSLATLAVPHFAALRERAALPLLPGQLRKSWYVLFFQLRGLADAAVERGNFALIERLWRDWSPGFAWDRDEMDTLKETFRQPGVRFCALAYYRAMLSPWLADSRRMNALIETPIPVPTLALTGALDGCLDTRFFELVPKALFPAGLRIERFDDAGHFLHQEAPERTNELLCGWLREHAGTQR